MVNDKFIQVSGPFRNGEEVIDKIKKDYGDFRNVTHIGIQTETGHGIYLNGQFFEIGKTGILQFNEIQIGSIYFAQDENASTLVDCVLD